MTPPPPPAAGTADLLVEAVQGAGHPNGTTPTFKGHPMTQTQELSPALKEGS